MEMLPIFSPYLSALSSVVPHKAQLNLFSGLWTQALNWLDGGEKADWLAGAMFTLRCLYVVFQDGSWWVLSVTRWKSKYRGILGPKQLEST